MCSLIGGLQHRTAFFHNEVTLRVTHMHEYQLLVKVGGARGRLPVALGGRLKDTVLIEEQVRDGGHVVGVLSYSLEPNPGESPD